MDSREKIEIKKIGLVATLGIAALLVSLFWLKGHKIRNYQQFDFYFRNVNGLEEGAAVRWNGLKVGVVNEVSPVLENTETNPIPSEELIKLGKMHLQMAEEELYSGKIENIALAREHINKAQMEIALGQASKIQTNVVTGQHVKVSAVITTKDVPINYFNQVTIVPSGIIGEQYLDISSLYLNFSTDDISFIQDNVEGIITDIIPQFVVLEPVKLDRLVRANLEAAEAVKNMTDRANALIQDGDIESFTGLIKSLDDLLADEGFRNTLKDFNLFKLIF